MDPIGAVVVTVIAASGLGFAVATKVTERRRLAEVARRLGLDVVERGWLSAGNRAVGAIRGRAVVVEPVVEGSGKNQRRFTRYAVEGAPPGVSFRRQGVWDDLVQVVTGDDLQVGDPAFDAAIVVKGDPLAVTALLDQETRARVAAFLTRGGDRVENGEVSQKRRGSLPEPDQACRIVEDLVRLAEELAATRASPRENLLRIAMTDPEPGVRLQAIETLAVLPWGSDIDEALLRASADRDPSVRLRACIRRASLEPLLELGLDEAADPATRAEALREAGLQHATRHRDPNPGAVADVTPKLVSLALGPAPSDLRAAALLALARLVPPAARGAARALREDNADDAAILAEAGAQVLGAEAEPALIRLLGSADPATRLAAIYSLGRVASVSAVEPLHALADRFLGLGGQATAASGAILAIQARAGEGLPGALALAEDRAGEVDLVEAGAVSLALRVPDAEKAR